MQNPSGKPVDKLSAPLRDLEKLIVANAAQVEAWFRQAFADCPPPFYCSVDLRNGGYKIAAIDTNLFPGGFNNLPPANHPLATAALAAQIGNLCPTTKSLLLVPENHTRNQFYLDNIAMLKHLIECAGIAVRIGRLDGVSQTLNTAGGEIKMEPFTRDGGRVRCGDFYPCTVLLNNDLSGGIPDILRGLEIPVMPAPDMGWAKRRKSSHFFHYQRAAEQLAGLLNADPWLLYADFSICGQVDFQRQEGMECLAAAVDETLRQIREKYRQHSVAADPFVVLKANAGTYGMGIMTARAAADVVRPNRKTRNKMAVGKEGVPISDVLIQEGIPTVDAVDEASAEPVTYLVANTVIGGFYRVNRQRGDSENLNSRGMSYAPLPFNTACAPPSPQNTDDATDRLYVYGVVARLAALAAAKESAALEKE